jgi:hypothetical protein
MGIHLEECSKLRIIGSEEDFRGMKAPLCAVGINHAGHELSLGRLMKKVCSAQKAIEIPSASGGEVPKIFCSPLLRSSQESDETQLVIDPNHLFESHSD